MTTPPGAAAGRPPLPVARDHLGAVLSVADTGRVGAALLAMTGGQRRELDATLASAAGDLERTWVLKALAAGNDLAAVSGFATRIRGREARRSGWLAQRLRPLDPDRTGRFDVNGRTRTLPAWMGAGLRQSTNTTCGSMCLLLSQAMHDPVYALDLAEPTGNEHTGNEHTGSMADRLATEERRIHAETNRFRVEQRRIRWWPLRLGTFPHHAAGWLSGHTGLDYRVSWHATRSPSIQVASDPLLLLVGNLHPGHYLLAFRQDPDGILMYNPSGNLHRELTTGQRRLWATIRRRQR